MKKNSSGYVIPLFSMMMMVVMVEGGDWERMRGIAFAMGLVSR